MKELNASLQLDKESLEKRVEASQREKSQTMDTEAVISTLKREFEVKEQQLVEENQQANASLQEHLGELEVMQEENASLKEKFEALESELQDAQARLQAASNKNEGTNADQVAHLESKCAELEKRLETERREKESSKLV